MAGKHEQELRNEAVKHEQELPNEAVRLIVERGFSIQQALWAAYRNNHHKMEHWQTLLTIANSGDTDKVRTLENRVGQFESLLKKQKTQPPKNNSQQLTLLVPAKLALPAPAGNKSKGKGKAGKGKSGKGKKGKGQGSQSAGVRDFKTIKAPGSNASRRFFQTSSIGPCWACQEGKCSDTACARPHICVRCGAAVPHNSCGCH